MKELKLFLSFCFSLLVLTGGAAADPRVEQLDKFLARYSPTSPLRELTEEIVRSADKYGLDYRLYVALAGAESSWGRKFPKNSNNLTGIFNGSRRFSSIKENIDFTHKTIAEKHWYRRFQKTGRLEDMAYIYKGVPPYERYIRTLYFSYNKIKAMPVEDKIIRFSSKEDSEKKANKLLSWKNIRYDQLANREIIQAATAD